MRRLALRLLGQEADAEDAVQEAWLSTLEAPPAADRPARPWLDVVTRNAALQSLRRSKRRTALESAQAPQTGHPTPQEALERAEIHRRAVDALLALPEPYRGTLLLRYFEDLSSEEIARREGLPAATIRTRLKRGLDALRERLQEREGDWRRTCALLAGVPRAPARWTLPLWPILILYGGALAVGIATHPEAPPPAPPVTAQQQKALAEIGYAELGYVGEEAK